MRPADNPFRSERMDGARYRLPDVSVDELLDRWETAGRRGAVVGGHGTGKTRLLAELVVALRRRRYTPLRLRLDRRQPCAARDLDGVVLLADGYDSLSLPSRLRLRWATRRCRGVIVSTHEACALPVLYTCRPDLPVLEQVVEDLAGPLSPRLRGELPVLWKTHHGNMRDVLRALYDHCAAL